MLLNTRHLLLGAGAPLSWIVRWGHKLAAASPELTAERRGKRGELAPNEAFWGGDLSLVPSDSVPLVRTVYAHHRGSCVFTWAHGWCLLVRKTGNGCCVGSCVSQNAVAILLSLFGCNPFEIIADITWKYFMWPCLILFSFKVIMQKKNECSFY